LSIGAAFRVLRLVIHPNRAVASKTERYKSKRDLPVLKIFSIRPATKARVEMVLRPGFEPGSTAREAVILDRTILPEPVDGERVL
jgi:hypothetical protein